MTLTRDLPLVPRESALLFVDVQNFCARRDGGEFKDLPKHVFDERYGWFFDEFEAVCCRTWSRFRPPAAPPGWRCSTPPSRA
jgi:hypothetical protein